MKIIIFILTLIFIQPAWPESNLPIGKIKLPPGFHIDVYTDKVPDAREMSFSPSGIMYVGSMNGNVYAVIGDEKTHKVRKVMTIAQGIVQPVGVAYYNKALYVSSIYKILRFDDIESLLYNPPKPVIVSEAFPADRWHGWKFIRFGPDKMLYVPVGVPCNICLPKDSKYGTITRMTPQGDGLEVFASGIRNSVGFDWHPGTKELWFTDNGRDYMGDDQPPDELNKAPVKGLNFGFPFVHGKNLYDPEYKNQVPERFSFVQPEMELGPHVAALGMRFYTGSMFPDYYQNQIFIAEHGSWNRSVPIGYRVTLVRLDKSGDHAISYNVFASGWLEDGAAWGRPDDVEIGPDGALYVSDDKAGAIYRIWYKNE